MTNIISGMALRDKLLARLAVKDDVGWLKTLAVPSHRELLGLIAREQPESIGRLAELAAKAQPNVSRSLAALVAARLVELENRGRRSIPRLTQLGQEKALELGLVATSESNSDQPVGGSVMDTGFELAVSPLNETQELLDPDYVEGAIALNTRLRDGSVFEGNCDAELSSWAEHLTSHWWRIVYRADAPYQLAEFRSQSGQLAACSVRSTGRHVEISLRRAEPETVTTIAAVFSAAEFESILLDSIVRPVVAIMRSRHRYDSVLESNLSRIEESWAFPNEYRFCRTAGALGFSPSTLGENVAASVRRLIEVIDDEDVRLDFASAVLGEELEAGCEWVARELRPNRLPRLPELRSECLASADMKANKPYKIGVSLARAVRSKIRLPSDCAFSGVDGLAEQMGADESVAFSSDPPGSLLAFQATKDGEPTVATTDRGPNGSTFIFARAIGDYIAYGSKNSCVTDLYTERQALGRAFAAELLAPSEAVVTMLYREDKPMHVIGRHFGVSTEVVRRQYENNAQTMRANA